MTEVLFLFKLEGRTPDPDPIPGTPTKSVKDRKRESSIPRYSLIDRPETRFIWATGEDGIEIRLPSPLCLTS